MIRDKQLLGFIYHVQRGLNSSGLNLEFIDCTFCYSSLNLVLEKKRGLKQT